MTEPIGSIVPILSSPLKVRDKDGKLTAEDGNGGLVVTGTRGGHDAAEVIVLNTSGGSWRVQREVDKVNGVLDRDGRPVANVQRRAFKSTLIELPSGESIPVTKGQLRIFGMGCSMGDLASARAPFLRPNRYYTLTLKEALLQRPDKELLVALGAYIAQGMIDAQIQAAASSPA
jgi:hypothetical protein